MFTIAYAPSRFLWYTLKTSFENCDDWQKMKNMVGFSKTFLQIAYFGCCSLVTELFFVFIDSTFLRTMTGEIKMSKNNMYIPKSVQNGLL